MVPLRSGAHSADHNERSLGKGAEALVKRMAVNRGYGLPVPGRPNARPKTERKEQFMGATNVTRWIGIGLLGLPLYGVMTFFSSIDPNPTPTPTTRPGPAS